ncbi:MAG TPA: YtxH domain-containing protein [Puia sp.]|jgi:gas vesicle protein|nr:YtxH domain-containing protein [Puia sp.]
MNKTLITLLVGIGIGILIAPDKGSETWRKLVDGLNDLKDKVEDEAEELGEKAKKFARQDK